MTTREDRSKVILTPAQLRIRERCATVPRHVRRSIDRYREARGMVPLWNRPQQQGEVCT